MSRASRRHRSTSGLLADGLTGGRLLLSVPLALFAFSGDWSLVALLLAASWWSDFFDGRLARRATEETRFSKFDLVADTFVGVAVVIGMLLGGHVPWVVGVGAGLLLAGYVMLGNASLGMLVQAIGYGIALILASNSGGPGFQVAVTTIALIAVAGFSRFRDATLPEFFGGLGRLWQAVLVTLRHGGRR